MSQFVLTLTQDEPELEHSQPRGSLPRPAHTPSIGARRRGFGRSRRIRVGGSCERARDQRFRLRLYRFAYGQQCARPSGAAAVRRRSPAMLRQLRPGSWKRRCSAERPADLEHRGPRGEEDRRRQRAFDGSGRHDCGRAPGIGRLGLADELGCRVGAHRGREWLSLVVPLVITRFAGRALAPERPLPVRGFFVFDGPRSGGNRGPHARTLDVDDDAHGIGWPRFCKNLELPELAILNTGAQGSARLMYGRPQRRSLRPRSPPASIRRRWTQFSERRGGATNLAEDGTDESTPKISVLEAEILGLRQLLAELRANGYELRQEVYALRRDRDHWRNQAKSAGAEKAEARAWFCGRASSGA